MPVEIEEKSSVFMTCDGKTIQFNNLSECKPIIATDLEPLKPKYALRVDPSRYFTGSIKMRRLSRKRFVNNMRKIGFTNKQAKKIAWSIKVPYSVAWMRIMLNRVFLTGNNAA